MYMYLITVGMFGGTMILAGFYFLWRERVQKRREEASKSAPHTSPRGA